MTLHASVVHDRDTDSHLQMVQLRHVPERVLVQCTQPITSEIPETARRVSHFFSVICFACTFECVFSREKWSKSPELGKNQRAIPKRDLNSTVNLKRRKTLITDDIILRWWHEWSIIAVFQRFRSNIRLKFLPGTALRSSTTLANAVRAIFFAISVSNRLQSQYVYGHQLLRREIQQAVSPAGHRLQLRHAFARTLGADLPVLLPRTDLPNCARVWMYCFRTLPRCESWDITLTWLFDRSQPPFKVW